MTCGGNEVLKASIEGADRLYINDGRVIFQNQNLRSLLNMRTSPVSLTLILTKTEIMIFIGNLANQTAYGQPVDSYLYLNSGKGKFDLATRETIFYRRWEWSLLQHLQM